MSDEPVVFISHKHSDRVIAEALAQFVKTKTAGKARVFLSSSPNFEGPRLGQPLSLELKRALSESELVILVYTNDREDWSWCMWECGVAVDPRAETATSVVVVQCAADEPKPFSDQVRVDARDLVSVQGFVKALLTTNELFQQRTEPITGFSGEGKEIQEFAAELHGKFAEVIPTGVAMEQATPTAPYLRLFLTSDAAETIRLCFLAGDDEQSLKTIETETRIVDEDGASALFRMHLGPTSTLGDVLAYWRGDATNAGEQPRWFEALADQIEAALAGQLRPVKWAPYRAVQGEADLPFVAGSRQVPDGVEFDVYVVPISPRPVPVRERMLRIEDTFHKDASTDALDQILLSDLVKEMAQVKATRLPITDGGHAKTIVHKATINDFVATRALEVGSVADLTLADLLVEHAMALENSYAEVPPDATMEEAVEAMAKHKGCQDVYVTDNDVVVGWLTNVMFIDE